MKIASIWTSDYDFQLPPEIIAVVVSHINASTSEDLRRKTLWACCLLSRAWYHAAIASLYNSPELTNKNFDLFARTLCPPINAHIRRVGLENFVKHLDMGRLAYESKKSLTARLLRRTKDSLETFVAPAVSFSITCLAPLSKCSHLRRLDLSRDYYDIDLTQLLDSIHVLTNLRSLSLPRAAMRSRCRLKTPTSEGGVLWPPNLQDLEISYCLPQDLFQWQEMFNSWPTSLTSLGLENCLNWNPFWDLHQGGIRAPNIRLLRVGMRRGEDGFPTEILLTIFPGLQSLAVPAPLKTPDYTNLVHIFPGKGRELQRLVLRRLPDTVQPQPRLKTSFLTEFVEVHPSLTRIDVPEAYLLLDEDQATDDIEEMERLIATRISVEQSNESGVFLMDI